MSGSLEDRVVEYVDHLHEHFVDPVVVRDGRYMAPDRTGLQHHDAAGVAGALRVPERRGLEPAERRRGRGVSDRLAARSALITGAGSGIGRASALLFAAEGAGRRRGHRRTCRRQETVRLITARAGEPTAFQVDVTDPARPRRSPRTSWRGSVGIDVLFNNAGIAGIGVLHETPVELWDRVMAVNVRGVFLIARAVLPAMIAARRGSIINMSSTIAEIGLANRALVRRLQGGGLALTRQMQADYASYGIRVNALLPGTIHTPFVDRYLAESYDDRSPVSRPSRNGS